MFSPSSSKLSHTYLRPEAKRKQTWHSGFSKGQRKPNKAREEPSEKHYPKARVPNSVPL